MKERLLSEIAAIDAQLAKGDEKLKAVYENMKEDRVKQLEALEGAVVTIHDTPEARKDIEDAIKANQGRITTENVIEPAEEFINTTIARPENNKPYPTDEEIVKAQVDALDTTLPATVYICSKCQKVCMNGTGLSAHERKCKA